MSKEEKDFDRIEREYLAPPNRQVIQEMHHEFVNDLNDLDEFAEFEEWTYFENGKRVTVKRPNPRYKPPQCS